MKGQKLVFSFLFLTLAASCAGPKFNNRTEDNNSDIIKDESFSRFNFKRVDEFDKSTNSSLSKAIAACHSEKFAKALDIFESNLKEEKTNPFYWNAIASCYYLSNDQLKANFYFDLAEESLKNYKGNNKENLQAAIENNRGLIHLKNKRFNEAFDSFKKASGLSPKLITPKINMAQIFLEFDQNERAIDILKNISSNDLDISYSLSLAYYKVGEIEKSYQALININPNSYNRADIVGIFALNLMHKNKLTEAKKILEKRNIANEFEERNKKILAMINEKIKDLEVVK